MELQTWTITGPAGFHFGRHGLGMEESAQHFASDSLFSALTACLAESSGPARSAAAVNAWIAHFSTDPPAFALSSAFPFAGGVRFFPAPRLTDPAAQHQKTEAARSKDLKRVKFVSEALFRQMLAGQPLSALLGSSQPLQNGAVLVSPEEITALPALDDGRLWENQPRPRVTVGRADSQSALFFAARVVFAQGCGLWFGARWLKDDPALRKQLALLLGVLADNGLGADRAAGFGQAAIQEGAPLSLPAPEGKHWVALGRYLPREDEMSALLDPRAAYTLETVGGWVDSPLNKSQRRRALRLIAEGSLLGPLSRAVPGQMVDVQPDYGGTQPLGHPVWRCGYALGAGIG